jgi:2-amino-4-hydroxy-6-hydroxymethyldihydropteridine diphosphokinase
MSERAAHGRSLHPKLQRLSNRAASASGLHLYAIGLGSNRPLRAHLPPRRIIAAAMAWLNMPPFHCLAASPIIATAPLGPSTRVYANAAALIATHLPPPALLAALHKLEAQFGRRRARRWGARTLDLDILLWSGGRYRDRRLTIPHVAMAQRTFVLEPLAHIVPRWREPQSGQSVRQLAARQAKSRGR